MGWEQIEMADRLSDKLHERYTSQIYKLQEETTRIPSICRHYELHCKNDLLDNDFKKSFCPTICPKYQNLDCIGCLYVPENKDVELHFKCQDCFRINKNGSYDRYEPEIICENEEYGEPIEGVADLVLCSYCKYRVPKNKIILNKNGKQPCSFQSN